MAVEDTAQVEPTAESQTESQPVEQEETQQPEPQAEATAEPEEDREPGGDSPTAVYARKQYREAKRLREEKARLELERARLEGELQALKQAPKQPEQPTGPTIEQVYEAIRNGVFATPEDLARAYQFIAREEAKAEFRREQERQRAEQPLKRAEADVQAYVEHLPELADRSSRAFQQTALKYQELLSWGYPDDVRTQRIALEMTHGSLEKLRSKKEVDRMTRETLRPHTEAPAGGTPPPKRNSIDAAPAHMKANWERLGVSQADREKEYRYWLAKQGQRRSA